MVKKKTAIPDAWDDDWEAQADKAEEASSSQTPHQEEEPEKISKAERLAKHAELNKKLWDSAEKPPELAPFLQALSPPIPLKSEYKPTLKVLARKPAPKTIIKIDAVTGRKIEVLEEEEEEEGGGAQKLSVEEKRAKAMREREEKLRRYDEARAKIFGAPARISPEKGSGSMSIPGEESSATALGGIEITPRTVKSKIRGDTREMGESRRPGSSNSTKGQGQKELFDPNYTPKPSGVVMRGVSSSGRSMQREESQVLRQPRAPDGSGGFGQVLRQPRAADSKGEVEFGGGFGRGN